MTDIFERVVTATLPRIEQRGVLNVPVAEICIAAGASEAEVATVFDSVDKIVMAALDRREREWTHGFIESGARSIGSTPEDRLIAIFDILTSWFHDRDFEGCLFTNVLIELGPAHPLGRACIRHLNKFRAVITTLAEEAELDNPHELADSLYVLIKGAIMSAMEGDLEAARKAIPMAEFYIVRHRAATKRGTRESWFDNFPQDDYDEMFIGSSPRANVELEYGF